MVDVVGEKTPTTESQRWGAFHGGFGEHQQRRKKVNILFGLKKGN